MSKKSFLVFSTLLVLILFGTVSIALGCHPIIVGYYKDGSEPYPNGFLYDVNTGVYTAYSGTAYSKLRGINEDGYIAGQFYDGGVRRGLIDNFLDTMPYTPVIYPGSTKCRLFAINSSNQAVGDYSSLTDPQDVYFYHGFYFDGVNYTSIDYPQATKTVCSGINDAGEIVGYWRGLPNITHGFVYENGVFTLVDHPNGVETFIQGINYYGTMVGYYVDTNGDYHTFTYNGTTFSDIDFPNESTSKTMDINKQGDIVGTFTDTDGVKKGFYFDGSNYRIIDYPADRLFTHVFGISDRAYY